MKTIIAAVALCILSTSVKAQELVDIKLDKPQNVFACTTIEASQKILNAIGYSNLSVLITKSELESKNLCNMLVDTNTQTVGEWESFDNLKLVSMVFPHKENNLIMGLFYGENDMSEPLYFIFLNPTKDPNSGWYDAVSSVMPK